MDYSRQTRFAPFGPAAQQRLGASSALIVGVGALGSHTAEALARAGIGHLSLVDRDIVEASNLQRQGLFTEADATAGAPKPLAAAQHLRAIRSDIDLTPLCEDFSADVFDALERPPDIVLDGTDNFPTRYLINDLAVRAGIPWIYGGAIGATGTAAVVLPGETPCLRCRLPEPPTGGVDTCETAGILSPTIAMVAAFQSIEALKILGGCLDAVCRGTLQLDLWNTSIRADGGQPSVPPSPACPTCGTRVFPTLTAAGAGPPPATLLCGRDAVQVQPRNGFAASDLDTLRTRAQSRGVEDLEARTNDGGEPVLLRFAADGLRMSVFPGGRALVFGTDQPGRARAFYDRYLT